MLLLLALRNTSPTARCVHISMCCPAPCRRRTFATEVGGFGILPESEFLELADSTLDAIEVGAGTLDDILLDRIDITNAQGVLTISLGSKGTYVINKQVPNRQLWWSSPVSGPRRYAWDATSRKWANTRDGHDMIEALRDELRALTGATIDIATSATSRPAQPQPRGSASGAGVAAAA